MSGPSAKNRHKNCLDISFSRGVFISKKFVFLLFGFFLISALANAQQPVVIAIFEEGVDVYQDAINDHLWTNPGELKHNGQDDDGNGMIDDTHGVDWTVEKGNAPQGNLSDLHPQHHGTHIAAMILGAHERRFKKLPIQLMVFKYNIWDPGTSLYESLMYAQKWGVKIFNICFTQEKVAAYTQSTIQFMPFEERQIQRIRIEKFYPNEKMDLNSAEGFNAAYLRYQTDYWKNWNQAISKIKELRDEMLIVAASGNAKLNLNERHIEPATLPYSNVLTVMNLDDTDQRYNDPSYGSNYGRNVVHVSARGMNIEVYGVGTLSGSSQATAKITRYCALILSEMNDFEREKMTPKALKARLFERLPFSPSLLGTTITGHYLKE